jgi:spore coat protein CotH
MNRLLLFLLPTAIACTSQDDKVLLPQIHISADTILWHDKRPVTIAYKATDTAAQLPAKASYRGGSSSKYHKHSYALKLKNEFQLANLPESKAFILNASYIDKTLMRHRFSFDLYREMHRDNIAPMCAYAELSENGDYRGIYVVMQRVNAGLVGIKKQPDAGLWKEPPVFYENRIDPQFPDNYYQQKYPDISKADHSSEMDELHNFLFNSSDEKFANEVFRRFDRRNIIDWQLILLLSNNSDGQLKNFYLFREEKTAPFKIALWDYDHSFGRDGDGEYNMLNTVIEEDRCVLFRRLNEINPEGFLEKMAERYAELRSNGTFSSTRLHKMIQRYERELRPHIQRNTERWPHDAHWYDDDFDFDREINIINEYIDKRIPMLDERFGFQK